MEPTLLLKNPDIYPSDEVLENALGSTIYSVLQSLLETTTREPYGLNPEWKFYSDGKVWLGKVEYKKKTVFWLSICEGFFKAAFYFTEKHLEAIDALDIDESIKKEFNNARPHGRLIPMVFQMTDHEQLEDLLTVIRFKKSLK